MSINNKIRAILTITFTVILLGMGLLTASVPIYLEVIKQLSIPYAVILGGFFGVEGIKNYIKKKNEKKS